MIKINNNTMNTNMMNINNTMNTYSTTMHTNNKMINTTMNNKIGMNKCIEKCPM